VVGRQRVEDGFVGRGVLTLRAEEGVQGHTVVAGEEGLATVEFREDAAHGPHVHCGTGAVTLSRFLKKLWLVCWVVFVCVRFSRQVVVFLV